MKGGRSVKSTKDTITHRPTQVRLFEALIRTLLSGNAPNLPFSSQLDQLKLGSHHSIIG